MDRSAHARDQPAARTVVRRGTTGSSQPLLRRVLHCLRRSAGGIQHPGQGTGRHPGSAHRAGSHRRCLVDRQDHLAFSRRPLPGRLVQPEHLGSRAQRSEQAVAPAGHRVLSPHSNGHGDHHRGIHDAASQWTGSYGDSRAQAGQHGCLRSTARAQRSRCIRGNHHKSKEQRVGHHAARMLATHCEGNTGSGIDLQTSIGYRRGRVRRWSS